MITKKDFNLEIIRFCSMLFVILIHVFSNGFTEKENLNNIFYCLCTSAVPLFLILSGYSNSISYSRNKWSSLKFLNKLSLLLTYYVVSTFFYALVNQGNFWINLLTIQGSYHLYFLIILFLLEAFFPLLYKWVNTHAISCLTIFTLFSIMANYFIISNFSEILFVSPFTWGILFVFGIYLEKNALLKSVSIKYYCLISSSLLLLYYGMSIISVHEIFYKTLLNSIIRFSFSISLFIFLYKSAPIFLKHTFINSLVIDINKYSLYIYLIHPFIINLLNKKIFSRIITMRGFQYCFLSFLFVFILSFVCSFFIKKLVSILKIQTLNLLSF
ncbi:acyltransferase family protein [Enterococcus lactis]|uniref:acyltransferase family protein n=1 Tax=Enterococcus lactis TaxID=357441 RepID=UPI0040416D5B